MESTGLQKINLVRFADVPSTNSIAIELGQKGAPHGTVVLANRQSRGRGRMERSFASPPGGLYISIIIRPELESEQLPLITLAAGVACCKTVETLTGLAVRLKWPNDLYVGDKKLAGILTESSPYSVSERKVSFLVVGIGLNVNTEIEMFPSSLQESVTSLYCLQNKRYDPELFISGIVEYLNTFTTGLIGEKNALFSYWQQRDYLLGKDIRWQNPAGELIYGSGAGLHHDGCYTLRTAEGEDRYIIGGELRLVPS